MTTKEAKRNAEWKAYEARVAADDKKYKCSLQSRYEKSTFLTVFKKLAVENGVMTAEEAEVAYYTEKWFGKPFRVFTAERTRLQKFSK